MFNVPSHLKRIGSRLVYSGHNLEFDVTGLSPHTTYSFRVRTSTDGDQSELSESVAITTEEAGSYKKK